MQGLTCPAEGCEKHCANKDGTASHMAQTGDSQHPWNSYDEAAETLESGGENPETASGSESNDSLNPPGDGDEPGGSRDDADHVEQDDGDADRENPILRGPSRRGTVETCPDCGDALDRLGSGMSFIGDVEGNEMKVTTDDGDLGCESCELIKSESGTVIRNVR